MEVSASISVRAVATPGHTFNHLSYVLLVDGAPLGMFSGGPLCGSTGRTDLLGADVTDLLAHAQYHSAHHLAQELADDTPIFPTHGFGSFCSASETVGTMSTIGAEKRANPALTQTEDRLVSELLAGLDAYPAYYAHMGAANLAAPDSPPDLSPVRRADPVELQVRIDAGEWVVDLRNRTAFADGHMAGTLNFGLDGSFATYLGWLIPWGTPLSLLGESSEQILEAQRELVRIGIDRPVAGVDGAPELVERMGEIPPGRIWVHRRTGYRASLAASLLAAGGREVVLIDDHFDHVGAELIDPARVAA